MSLVTPRWAATSSADSHGSDIVHRQDKPQNSQETNNSPPQSQLLNSQGPNHGGAQNSRGTLPGKVEEASQDIVQPRGQLKNNLNTDSPQADKVQIRHGQKSESQESDSHLIGKVQANQGQHSNPWQGKSQESETDHSGRVQTNHDSRQGKVLIQGTVPAPTRNTKITASADFAPSVHFGLVSSKAFGCCFLLTLYK